MTEKPRVKVKAGSVRLGDGLKNVAANLGTSRDKASYSTYVYTPLGYPELLASYRSAWLPRAIVDIPANDATRKWRSWNAEPEQVTKLEKLEKRLRLSIVIKDALIAARLFGGAAVYFGTNDKASDKPLDPSKVREIKTLTVLTPMQLTPGEIVKDIESPYYGRSEFYTLQSNDKAETKIHASRLIVLEGAPVPDVTLRLNSWGDSVLQSVMDAILQADSTNANINSLIFEAKVDVFRFSGMMEAFQREGGDALLQKRLSAQALIKGINGAVVLDKEDEYDQKNASFGSLPDLMDRFRLLACGAAGIPETRLFGRAAAGLSGSGDGDERVYFDTVQHDQNTVIEPAMSVFDECLIWAALGSRPEEVHYTWRPLRQITEKERADIFKTTADAARAIAGTQAGELIPVEPLSDSLVNELVEQGVLPGLEQKMKEYGTLAENNEEGEDTDVELTPEEIAAQQAQDMKDAAPRTLYVRRDVLNRADIVKWAKSQGFTDIVDDLHVTITYSSQPVDWFKMGESWSPRLEIGAGGPRQMDAFGDDGKYKVLLITASDLVWRHREMIENGASWDRDDYQPHISIQIGGDVDLSKVQPYQGKIILGPEIFEELRND